MHSVIDSAFFDIGEALRRRAVWIALASEDIGDQHRRTTLGPLWMLINYLALAGTFILIFGAAGRGENFAAYASVGLFVWLFLAETLTLSSDLFVREASFIRGTTLPLTTYVLRLTLQSVIRSAYALVGCVAILLVAGVYPVGMWLWSIPGMALIVLTAPPVILIFAIAGAHFPDLRFLVQNVIRLGMFLTPIFWGDGDVSGLRGLLYHFNPFTYYLEVVRMPITDGVVSLRAWAVCLTIALLAWIVGILMLGRSRKQIVFVL
ncbi:MAG: ABC transporter permease [Ahrensia sp.]|nr:ABC transporter permease [Ahrensia sp.]